MIDTDVVKTQVAAAQSTVSAALALIKHFGTPPAAHAVWIATRFGEDGTGHDTIMVAVRPGSKWEAKVEKRLDAILTAGKWRTIPVERSPWPRDEAE